MIQRIVAAMGLLSKSRRARYAILSRVVFCSGWRCGGTADMLSHESLETTRLYLSSDDMSEAVSNDRFTQVPAMVVGGSEGH